MRAAGFELGGEGRNIALGLALGLGLDIDLALGRSTPPRLPGTACVPRAVRPTS